MDNIYTIKYLCRDSLSGTGGNYNIAYITAHRAYFFDKVQLLKRFWRC